MNIARRFNRVAVPHGIWYHQVYISSQLRLPTLSQRSSITTKSSSMPLSPSAITTRTKPKLLDSQTARKLNHILPKLDSSEDLLIAREYITLLSTFDKGIHINDQVCDRLIELYKLAQSRSDPSREMLKISRIRLLKILYTNRKFLFAFQLLLKNKYKRLFYDKSVRSSMVAGILINLHYHSQLNLYIRDVLTDTEVPIETRTKFIRSIVKNFVHNDQIGLAMKYWYIYSMTAYGKLNFDNHVKYADCLGSLHLILNNYNQISLIPFLLKFKELQKLSNHHFSMLLSSCIYKLTGKLENLPLVQLIWNFKSENKLEMIPSDLSSIMASLYYNKLTDQLLQMYKDYPILHEDNQFDILLKIHGSERHWQLMQRQFEDLFGRGELPNITHYGIVMFSLATRGETSAVMMLWDQLHSRKMIPSIPVLHALIMCNINEGNYRNALVWYRKMPQYGLKFTPQSYTFLFSALRGLKEPRVQLKFFKKLLVEEKVELPLNSIKELLMTSLEMSDVVMGEYVFKTLKNRNYDFDDSILAIMMNIYNNAGQFEKVEEITQDFVSLGKRLSTKLYNQLLLRFLKSGDYETLFQIFGQMRDSDIELDNYSYSFLLSALVKSENLEQAMGVFDDLSSEFNVRQYNHFMHTLYNSPKNFKLISKIYDIMIEREVTPTLESYECLIKGLCKQYELELERTRVRITHKTEYIDREWLQTRDVPIDTETTIELAVKVLKTLLKEKNDKDLENITSTRNLPFNLFYKVFTLLLNYDFNLCKEMLIEFYDSCGDKELIENDYRFIYISLKIYSRDQNVKEFEQLFEKYCDDLRNRFAINPISEKILKRATPSHLRYGLSKIWPMLLEIYKEQDRHQEIWPKMKELISKGFLFSNHNNNQTVVAMMRSHDSYMDALLFIESKMINGYIYLRRKRKYLRLLSRAGVMMPTTTNLFSRLKFNNYLEGLLYIKMVQMLRRKILPKDGLERKLLLKKLTKKFPKTMRFYPYRARVADKFYMTFLKFRKRGYKKVKSATEFEGNQLRHERRMIRNEKWRLVKQQMRRMEKQLKLQNTTLRNRRGERFGFTRKRHSNNVPKFAQNMENDEVVKREVPNPFKSKTASVIDSFKS